MDISTRVTVCINILTNRSLLVADGCWSMVNSCQLLPPTFAGFNILRHNDAHPTIQNEPQFCLSFLVLKHPIFAKNVAVFLLLTFWLVLDAAVYPHVRTRFATNITGIHRLPPHRTSQVELPISASHPVHSARCQAASGYHPKFCMSGECPNKHPYPTQRNGSTLVYH